MRGFGGSEAPHANAGAALGKRGTDVGGGGACCGEGGNMCGWRKTNEMLMCMGRG